jgi:peptidoglycan hydrolase-like protein with peptidoglycan-binding domain
MSAVNDTTKQHDNNRDGRRRGPGTRTVFARAFTLGAVTVAAAGGITALSVGGANASTHRPAAITQVKKAKKAPAGRYQRGPWVSQLQRDLGQLNYYESPVDGVYGPQTTAAVKDFQRANGLVVDGIDGPATMAKIKQQLITGDNQMNKNLGPAKTAGKAPAVRTTNAPVRYQRGPWVSRLQRDLGQLNYYESPVDGVYGPQTSAAVKDFQRANGLVVDGVAGPATMAKINKQLITGDNQMNANLSPAKTAPKAPAAVAANVSTGSASTGNGSGGAAIAPASAPSTSGGAGLAPAGAQS